MADELINQAAELMREQARAYRRLDSACAQLATALASGLPETISALVRAGEAELLSMRSRLIRLMSSLTSFADSRASSPAPISGEARAAFAQASNELMQAASDFQRTRKRAAALANNGSVFAAVSIEMCGIPPVTYRAPYTRRAERER
jgi:hypothetical protein